ncbi:MAG: hypothetical protein ACOYK1_01515 [Vampirovibrionia bacterium]|jgi:hypothetical protein
MINETQIKDAVADLCGLIRNQKIRSTEQDKIFEIFRKRFNEYLDEWRELTSRSQSEAHNLFGFMNSPYNNDLFNIIKDSFRALTELYKKSDDNINKNIFLLIFQLIYDQVSKPQNEKILNTLLYRFHRVIFEYELQQSPINRNNLERVTFRVFSEITFSDSNVPLRDYFSILNQDFHAMLCRLIDHSLEDFIYQEIFKENIFRFQYLRRFRNFFIKSLYDISSKVMDLIGRLDLDHSIYSRVEELNSQIQKFYDVDQRNNNIDLINKNIEGIIIGLKELLSTVQGIDSEILENFLSETESNLGDTYNHNLLILSIFEFLAYAYNKEKYDFISKLINYRYIDPANDSIPLLIPNHFYDAPDQLETFLYIAFNYFSKDELSPYYGKPRYLKYFTIIYLCYCFIQESYGDRWHRLDNHWKQTKKSINDALKTVFREEDKISAIRNYQVQPYLASIEQLKKGLAEEKLETESEKALKLFQGLIKYNRDLNYKHQDRENSINIDQQQFLKDKLNEGLDQAEEFFKMILGSQI